MSLPSNVVDASKLFAQRACPLGAIVQHSELGQGRVRLCDGFWREVDFASEISKTPNELTPDEWPDDVSAETLVSVSWIQNTPTRLHIHELKLIAPSHYPSMRAWSGFPC